MQKNREYGGEKICMIWIIIGAGPAGISAGIYAVSRGKKALILEKNEVGD